MTRPSRKSKPLSSPGRTASENVMGNHDWVKSSWSPSGGGVITPAPLPLELESDRPVAFIRGNPRMLVVVELNLCGFRSDVKYILRIPQYIAIAGPLSAY